MNKKPLYEIKKQEILCEIEAGVYGKPGEAFITTRNLAASKKISLVNASKVMSALSEEKVIELIGKRYYLTHGLIGKNTPYPAYSDKNRLIGIHVTLFDAFSSSIVKAIESYAKEKGYQVISSSSSYHVQEEKEVLNLFRKLGVSGVISAPWKENLVSGFYKGYCLPVVFIGHKPKDILGDCVQINYYSAGRNMARHFLELGFSNFAYVGIDVWENADDRFRGYNEELNRAGFGILAENIIVSNANQSYDISNRLRILLKKQKKPLAIFCFHDILALSTIHTCQFLGCQVPEEVAVGAFENNFPVALYSTPKITTIGYQVKNIAKKSVDLLIQQINSGEIGKEDHMIEPMLTVRESTKQNKETS